jgi:hypothetical protein
MHQMHVPYDYLSLFSGTLAEKDRNLNTMGFITAVTVLTPEVGGASENRDLSFRRNSIQIENILKPMMLTLYLD